MIRERMAVLGVAAGVFLILASVFAGCADLGTATADARRDQVTYRGPVLDPDPGPRVQMAPYTPPETPAAFSYGAW